MASLSVALFPQKWSRRLLEFAVVFKKVLRCLTVKFLTWLDSQGIDLPRPDLDTSRFSSKVCCRYYSGFISAVAVPITIVRSAYLFPGRCSTAGPGRQIERDTQAPLALSTSRLHFEIMVLNWVPTSQRQFHV